MLPLGLLGAIPTKIKIGLAIAAVFGVMAVIIWLGQKEIRTLHDQIGVLNTAVATQQATISTMQQSAEINNKLMGDYDRRLKDIAEQNAKFRKKLADSNIQQLSKTNPEEAQGVINGMINGLMERLENVSRGGVK